MSNTDNPNSLECNIAAFNERKEELESAHSGKWVIFHDGQLIGIFDSLQAAAEEAVQRFGRGPYLIRQVGAPTDVVLPASVAYHLVDAAS